MEINKIAREIARMTATELDELTGLLLHEYGMAATLYHYSAGITNVEIPTECSLFLKDAGSLKLHAIKLIKESFDLGLRDAKHIIDSAPCYLKEFMGVDEGERIKEELEAIGATVEIKYHGK